MIAAWPQITKSIKEQYNFYDRLSDIVLIKNNEQFEALSKDLSSFKQKLNQDKNSKVVFFSSASLVNKHEMIESIDRLLDVFRRESVLQQKDLMVLEQDELGVIINFHRKIFPQLDFILNQASQANKLTIKTNFG